MRFHLHERPGRDKSIDTDIKLVLARVWGQRGVRRGLMGVGLFLG